MCMAQVVVVNTVPSFHSLPAIHVSQMVQCLARARIWQRVCHFSFACEQWLGPVSHVGPTQTCTKESNKNMRAHGTFSLCPVTASESSRALSTNRHYVDVSDRRPEGWALPLQQIPA